MAYYIGQALGLVATVCCFVTPLFKKKWQMLVIVAASNLLFALNLLLIDQVSSAIYLYLVAIVQAVISYWHVQKDKPVTKAENIVFLILYVACGAIGFKSALDILPIVGAVFNMLATFQTSEQRTRALLFVNAAFFALYYALIGSTALLSVLCTMGSTALGMWRYRKG